MLTAWQLVPKEPTEKMLSDGNEASLSFEALSDDARFSVPRLTWKAMLAAAPTGTAWQPIETAPKDGTRILIFHGGNDDGESVQIGYFVLPAYRSQGRGGWRTSHASWIALDEPSHWMALPDPPEAR